MRISDWSSDVCSSDLCAGRLRTGREPAGGAAPRRPAGAGARAARRSEERRVGKEVSVRVDLGGRRIIKKKKKITKTPESKQKVRQYTDTTKKSAEYRTIATTKNKTQKNTIILH